MREFKKGDKVRLISLGENDWMADYGGELGGVYAVLRVDREGDLWVDLPKKGRELCVHPSHVEPVELVGTDRVLGFSVLIWDSFDGSFKKNARLYSPTWQRAPGVSFATENWWEYRSEEDIEEFIDKHKLPERFPGRFLVLKEWVTATSEEPARGLSTRDNARLGGVRI